MQGAATEFVFAYGSLVAEPPMAPTREFRGEGFVTDLCGFRRCWGVAMNNRITIPGYKYYLDGGGERPHVHVAFLDLRPARGHSVNGICRPVTPSVLSRLDRRERNYLRRDVTAFCAPLPDDIRVWTYIGTPSGRRRFTTARASGRAVIDRTYLESVRGAFTLLGPAEYAACAPSLDPGELPVLELARQEVASTTIER